MQEFVYQGHRKKSISHNNCFLIRIWSRYVSFPLIERTWETEMSQDFKTSTCVVNRVELSLIGDTNGRPVTCVKMDYWSLTLIRGKRPCVCAPYCKQVDLHGHALGGNVHSCTKLVNILSIRRRWHALTLPLRRNLAVLTVIKLCYANSSSVWRA